jgi:hypothetical protein
LICPSSRPICFAISSAVAGSAGREQKHISIGIARQAETSCTIADSCYVPHFGNLWIRPEYGCRLNPSQSFPAAAQTDHTPARRGGSQTEPAGDHPRRVTGLFLFSENAGHVRDLRRRREPLPTCSVCGTACRGSRDRSRASLDADSACRLRSGPDTRIFRMVPALPSGPSARPEQNRSGNGKRS